MLLYGDRYQEALAVGSMALWEGLMGGVLRVLVDADSKCSQWMSGRRRSM